MRFGLVPEEAKKARPWTTTRSIGPPPGYGEIVAFVEAQVDEQTQLGRGFRLFVYLEPGDLELIQEGHPIEFGVYNQYLTPVSVTVHP